MAEPTQPFPLPRKLSPGLDTVYRYWQGLVRGGNAIPFSDDVNLSQLPDLSGDLMLIDVFADPQRFRINRLGKNIISAYGSDITGRFVDHLDLHKPFDYLLSQSSAAVEGQLATFYSCSSAEGDSAGYSRILLPTWGNGQVSLLLGAIS
jgi:hypothetical protein